MRPPSSTKTVVAGPGRVAAARNVAREDLMESYEVNIGASVHSKDGKNLGKVEHLIVQAETGMVYGFLLEKGMFSTKRIVATGFVQSTDKNGIVLSLTGDEADQLPAEIHDQMVSAPDGLTMSTGWGGLVDISGTGGQRYLRGNQGGDLPNTGSPSFFQGGMYGNVEVENITNIPEDAILISEGTDVVGNDGEKIGQIDEVFVGSDRRVTGALLKAGRMFHHHDITIPISMVAGASHKHVRLNVPAEEARRQGEHKPS
jgi:uncharacterized protein YrrD